MLSPLRLIDDLLLEIHIMVLRLLSTVLVLFFALNSSAGACEKALGEMHRWDKILTDDFFRDVAPFRLSIRQESKERVYMFSIVEDNGSPLMSVLVTISAVGKQLNPSDWEAAASKSSDVQKAREFPKIGARAQVRPAAFGPDGALTGVVFATPDELFDVSVSVFEASSATQHGSLSALEAARRIEQAYADTLNNPCQNK